MLKTKPKKRKEAWGRGKKSSGLGVFLTMLVICLYTILKPAERLQLPPSTAQTLRPLRLGGGAFRGGEACVCVCVQGRNDQQGRGKPPEEGKASRVASLSLFFFYLCLCMFLFKVVKIKSTTKNVHLPVLSKL